MYSPFEDVTVDATISPFCELFQPLRTDNETPSAPLPVNALLIWPVAVPVSPSAPSTNKNVSIYVL